MTARRDWFEKIRTSPRGGAATATVERACQHPGCRAGASHRAPQGRDREGQYFWFCLDHVREYNKSYNYFAGMSDDAVAAFQKEAIIGHRPTWNMGIKGGNGHAPMDDEKLSRGGPRFADPFGFFRQHGPEHPRQPEPQHRPIKNAERKALLALNLDASATAEAIKARYKELVKRLHPDANGGDRATEDKLRSVIQAYNYLKRSGLC